MPQKHLLFLTTQNYATNPRLYKEVKLAIKLNYRVTVATFRLGNWSDSKSNELGLDKRNLRLQEIKIDATKKSKYQWLKWGLLEKLARFLYPAFKKNLLINSLASNRRSMQILEVCKKTDKPDLIIVHNLGAAYPGFKLSRMWKIPFIFDVEDYHPGEAVKHDNGNEKKRREFLLQEILPWADGLTMASPLIRDFTLKLIGEHANHRVILNSFPEKEFNHPNQNGDSQIEPLKMVWFSQKISFDRGLELLFKALVQICNSAIQKGKNDIALSLTLIGDLDADFFQKEILPLQNYIWCTPNIKTISHKQHLLTNLQKPCSINLSILPAMPQIELHKNLKYFDIGLALEPGKDLNNQLALSNKIMAYAQAGLYILATNTPAQQEFMNESTNRGLICYQTPSSIATALLEILNRATEVKINFAKRFKDGHSLAWEHESSKLLSLWSTLLK